jgi:hypothetical protein
MRFSLFILFIACTLTGSFAQPAQRTKPTVYSASSDWQKISFKPTAPVRSTPATAVPTAAPVTTPTPAPKPVASTTSAVPTPVTSQAAPVAQVVTSIESAPQRPAPAKEGYRPAFTGDFATNRNGWKAGNKGDYNYQIGLGKYNIRKRKTNTKQAAFSYVALPTEINLNVAETFTIKVDVVADSGSIPTGGLLFGVADSLNYCAFSLNGAGEITIVRVVNGQPIDDYMPGDYFKPGVALEKNRDRLIIQRNGEELHFYINDREVRSSPYPFRMLSGNGIGLTTDAYWTSFQKLSVTLGL